MVQHPYLTDGRIEWSYHVMFPFHVHIANIVVKKMDFELKSSINKELSTNFILKNLSGISEKRSNSTSKTESL